jgi:hypothetical protein
MWRMSVLMGQLVTIMERRMPFFPFFMLEELEEAEKRRREKEAEEEELVRRLSILAWGIQDVEMGEEDAPGDLE